MTREEAIKILNPATSFDALLGMDREEGIKVVEEACLLAVADIEKQIPKKPQVKENGMFLYYVCPKCEQHLYYARQEYCDKCGTHIDWTEEGE